MVLFKIEHSYNKNGPQCNEPQKLNTKLLGFVICTRNIQLKNVYWLYKNA